MKNFILVCGPNGVGKSTACKLLTETISNVAFVDSEFCRYMNPFSFTDEEIQIVISNISNMVVNYFKCSTINNVVFPYGFHGVRKQIFSAILDVLSKQDIDYQFCPIILFCDLEENIRRMKKDNRDEERIQRAITKTRSIYAEYDYPQIDTASLSVDETVQEMINILKSSYTIDRNII